MHTLDTSLFFAIHGLSGHSAFIDWLIVFVGEYSLYLILLVFMYMVFREWYAKHMQSGFAYGVALAGALVARFGVVSLIRYFYHRPRPYVALNIPHLITDTAYSFPSGHTIFLFALATGVLCINKKFAYVLYACAVLVGIARVAAGVHYPSDIVGGAVLGIAVGYIVSKLWQKYTGSSRQ